MTFSIWHQSSRPSRRYDLVIIGGGISGLSTAYWMRKTRPSLAVAVLERATVGAGASGRNAGFMTCGSIAHFHRQCANLGVEAALELWSMTKESHRLLVAEGLLDPTCGYQQNGAFSLSRSVRYVEELREAAALLRANGEVVDDLASADAPLPSFAGGYWYGGDGQLDPMRLLHALRDAAGATLYEGTNVLAIHPSNQHLRLETPTGVFEAARVVVATNAYSPEWLPELDTWVRPLRAQALATAPATRRLPAPIYAMDDWAYLRQAEDRRIVLGGFRPLAAEDEIGTEDSLHPSIHAALDIFLSRHCASLFDGAINVERRWSGALGYAPDALPIVGELPVTPDGFFIGAHSGHGMGWGFIAAKRLVELMTRGSRPGALDVRRLDAPSAASGRPSPRSAAPPSRDREA